MIQNLKRNVAIAAVAMSTIGAGSAFAVFQQFRGAAALTVGDGRIGPRDMVWIPHGQFLMGSNHRQAQRNEGPAHEVRLSGYWIDRHDVTNAEFAQFVAATGYVTTAEQKPKWEDLAAQLPPGTPEPDDSLLVPGAMVFAGTDEPVPLDDYSRWWKFVPGASWKHPMGPDSSISGKENHPVVQVSYEDATAYAKWAHKRLPTEAEWEFAARGSLEQADYSWGAELAPGCKKMANTWDDGSQPFPVAARIGSSEKVQIGTMPVGSYAPNGYGLYDMAGNVWQRGGDRYRADAFRIEAAAAKISTNPPGPRDSFDGTRCCLRTISRDAWRLFPVQRHLLYKLSHQCPSRHRSDERDVASGLSPRDGRNAMGALIGEDTLKEVMSREYENEAPY